MQADLINPFIESALNVFKTMASTEAKAGTPVVKVSKKAWGEVTGLIGLAGAQVNGNMIISFDKASILSIVSKMLMEQFAEITPEVVDAVGEITNMITGGAKNSLAEQGLKIDMATPIMFTGQNIELKQLANAPIISVPFTTDAGQFVIEANLHKI